jgi:hypothetical protein
VLLSDRDHLAKVIADGDPHLAERLLGTKFDKFWEAIVPQESALPYCTVRTRIDRGLELLARDLDAEERLQQVALPLLNEETRVPTNEVALVVSGASCRDGADS